MQQKIDRARSILKEHDIDGWLIYDFCGNNSIGREVLGISLSKHLTRRFFYFIPKDNSKEPVQIVHRLEPEALVHLPGNRLEYMRWQELQEQLEATIGNCRSVLMEFSPRAAVPVVSKVDGGTIDLVREFCPVLSSAPFMQPLICELSKEQIESHKKAAYFLDQSVNQAWNMICKKLKSDERVTEWDVQQFLLSLFEENGYVTDGNPICAVGPHAADPHFSPSNTNPSEIKKGDVVLIDLWARKEGEGTVFGDITRMGIVGNPTAKQQKVFDTVRAAQKAAFDFVTERFSENKIVRGFEVDEVARDLIKKAGFADYFIHRTGHNLHTTLHGPGANMDGFETHDDRPLIRGSCFTIEPGIYIPGEFGVRLEHDVYLPFEGNPQIFGGVQDLFVALL